MRRIRAISASIGLLVVISFPVVQISFADEPSPQRTLDKYAQGIKDDQIQTAYNCFSKKLKELYLYRKFQYDCAFNKRFPTISENYADEKIVSIEADEEFARATIEGRSPLDQKQKIYEKYFVKEASEWKIAAVGEYYDSRIKVLKGKIAFCRNVNYYDKKRNELNIGVFVLDAGAFKKISGYYGIPEWSPDGKYLAVSNLQSHQINIYDSDGTVERSINTEYQPGELRWHPGGRFIYVVETTLGSGSPTKDILKLYDLSTNESRIIFTATGPEFVRKIELSRDGKYIAFETRMFGQQNSIQIIAIDGTEHIEGIGDYNLVGWLNSNELIIATNRNVAGEFKDDSSWTLEKYNVKEKVKSKIRDIAFDFNSSRLSEDKKYLYYVKHGPDGTRITTRDLETGSIQTATKPIIACIVPKGLDRFLIPNKELKTNSERLNFIAETLKKENIVRDIVELEKSMVFYAIDEEVSWYQGS